LDYSLNKVYQLRASHQKEKTFTVSLFGRVAKLELHSE